MAMLEVKESPSSLYHYTDLHALISILTNSELWLTDVNFLNDHAEYSVGRKYLKEKLNDFVEKVTHAVSGVKLGYDFEFIDAIFDRSVYLTSFCMQKDLLSQWRGYCPQSGGYAIEFYGQGIADSVSGNKDSAFLICNYDSKLSKSHLDEVLLEVLKIITEAYLKKEKPEYDRMLEQVEKMNTILFSTLVQKHEKFYEEKEVRLACQSTLREKKFRVKNSVLVPYVPFKFDVNTVSKIIIGPMADQAIAERGLSQFLESLVANKDHPLSKLPVIEHSDIPFRFI
ncbi:hypothetical protein PHACT_10130 [Pseudohongiella acticola]|uniref:DUF2971 domain-containing protein n=1 Tax=Pseudohongiella acticola TaxID=1524254 RepID=A0A1E8CLZ2_9GAMM|nr:DUF2971 domain-containing protein [Pseudohongiella acticola]OFE13449.1 hypothetical protein PHACT_10130 [Pseudohongiella acticola]